MNVNEQRGSTQDTIDRAFDVLVDKATDRASIRLERNVRREVFDRLYTGQDLDDPQVKAKFDAKFMESCESEAGGISDDHYRQIVINEVRRVISKGSAGGRRYLAKAAAGLTEADIQCVEMTASLWSKLDADGSCSCRTCRAYQEATQPVKP